MPNEVKSQRLTVYVGNSHTWQGLNLSMAIVECCRAQGMAGATVTRGLLGFGRHSHIHRPHVLGLEEDLPEKVEIIDTPERIAEFLPLVEAMVGGALVVLEDVSVIRP